MSSKNKVNPDHYKVAGRDTPAETVSQEVNRQQFKEAQTKPERRGRKAPPKKLK